MTLPPEIQNPVLRREALYWAFWPSTSLTNPRAVATVITHYLGYGGKIIVVNCFGDACFHTHLAHTHNRKSPRSQIPQDALRRLSTTTASSA